MLTQFQKYWQALIKKPGSTAKGLSNSLSDDLLPVGEINIPSQPGGEIRAVNQLEKLLRPLKLPRSQMERLKTAVAETTMNAMEHGNQYQPDKPVRICVLASETLLVVQVIDHGGDQDIPEAETPDLDAKLAGMQSPRGWGLFLVRNMVDEVRVVSDGVFHTVELVLNRKEED